MSTFYSCDFSFSIPFPAFRLQGLNYQNSSVNRLYKCNAALRNAPLIYIKLFAELGNRPYGLDLIRI
jgi:hypothetical protein